MLAYSQFARQVCRLHDAPRMRHPLFTICNPLSTKLLRT